MAGDVLREFLVRVNYQIDEKTEKRFTSSMRGAALQAKLLGDALIGLAKTTVNAVADIAGGLDNLYYASQRTGASVESIKSMSYAVSQMGGSASGAAQSLEAFARALRTNPGNESMVRALGVATRDDNGKLRDRVEILKDLGKVFARQPYYIANQYASALGIDEPTLQALIQGLEKYQDEYKRTARSVGLDSELAAKRGKEFMNAMRSLGLTIEVVATKIASDLQPVITAVINDLNSWIRQHSQQIKEAVEYIVTGFTDFVNVMRKVVTALAPAWEAFDKLSQSITGQNGLTTALEILAVYMAGSWVARILGAIGAIRVAWMGMLGLAGLGVALGIGVGGSRSKEDYDADPATPEVKRGANERIGAVKDWWTRTMPRALGGGGAPGWKMDAKKKDLAQESYDFWRKKGLGHEAALAMVGNEEGESGFNTGARGDGGAAHGIFQHHSARRSDIQRGTGINLSTERSHLKQLEAAHWEMTQGSDPQARRAWEKLKRARSIEEGAAAAVYDYERPADKAGETRKRAGIARGWGGHIRPGGVTVALGASGAGMTGTDWKQQSGLGDLLNGGEFKNFKAPLSSTPIISNDNSKGNTSVNMAPTTNITVMGGGPEVASAVGREVDRSNSALLRNTQGAVR